LSFWDPEKRRPTVDLFAEYPMNFERLYEDALARSLGSTTVGVASVPLQRLVRLVEALEVAHACGARMPPGPPVSKGASAP
jgi:hypothetical protein